MIQLSDLTKTFGDRVLFDHVTWQITDRERVGLCGPNGAGKTPLLKMMAGLDEPAQGAILKPSGVPAGTPPPLARAPAPDRPDRHPPPRPPPRVWGGGGRSLSASCSPSSTRCTPSR